MDSHYGDSQKTFLIWREICLRKRIGKIFHIFPDLFHTFWFVNAFSSVD